MSTDAAAAPAAGAPGGEAWKAQLQLPPKDTRIRTEVRGFLFSSFVFFCCDVVEERKKDGDDDDALSLQKKGGQRNKKAPLFQPARSRRRLAERIAERRAVAEKKGTRAWNEGEKEAARAFFFFFFLALSFVFRRRRRCLPCSISETTPSSDAAFVPLAFPLSLRRQTGRF